MSWNPSGWNPSGWNPPGWQPGSTSEDPGEPGGGDDEEPTPPTIVARTVDEVVIQVLAEPSEVVIRA